MIWPTLCRAFGRFTGALAAAGCLWGAASQAAPLKDLWSGTYWGESERALLAHFGRRVTVLPRALDFGDSYAQLVLRDVTVGGVALTGFLQIDPATHGLKRIQLQRQRHGANPPAFRAVRAAVEAEYGAADGQCGRPIIAATGYQAAAELLWHRSDVTIEAIFRDTTITAFEGCLAADPSVGACGLTGQLLVRIGPPGRTPAGCAGRP